MALISTKLHGVLDYTGGVGSLAAPKLLRDRRAGALLAATGAGTLATSSLTDYELGVVRRLPMRVHLLADAGTGALLLAGAYLLSRGKAKVLDWAPLAVVGVTELAAAALTERQPGDRARGGDEDLPAAAPGISGEGIAARTPAAEGPPLATPPVETPGPSVPAPASASESDVERAERVDALSGATDTTVEDAALAETPASGDVLAAQQASAAAAEAARIGGAVAPDADDPAMDPVYQAGGGEQEGWEETEAELIENATHGDGGGQPERDAFAPELESDRATAVYGEADRLPSTETVEDPATGPDDPDEGPGLSADRGSTGQPRTRRPTRASRPPRED
jgi:hypothetical protein